MGRTPIRIVAGFALAPDPDPDPDAEPDPELPPHAVTSNASAASKDAVAEPARAEVNRDFTVMSLPS
jgi:hypothetical protein